jgi:3-isopropylmalate/(R)-2-methylmalate dehydratase small subunit
MAGVSAILAKSVARIFFRNAINQGLPVLICDTDKISAGDEIEVNLTTSTITDLTKNARLTFGKIPKVMVDILNEGGLIPYITKHGDFEL